MARVFFTVRLGHDGADRLLVEMEGLVRQELEDLEVIDIDVVDLGTTLKAAGL